MNTEAIAVLLRQRLGLAPESLGAGVIPSAVRTRLRALGKTDAAAYARQVEEEPAEYLALVDTIVVPESWFFRSGQLFYYLAELFGSRTTAAARGPFRVLSVPCAAGQEPYSLAIAMEERGLAAARCQIVGVDVSPRQVDQAQQGVFSNFSFRELDPVLRNRYFEEGAEGWGIRPLVRERVRFTTGNVVDPQFLLGEPPFDLIFCRNLLIYLHPAARQQVLDTLDRLLAPDGLACTGSAEPLAHLDARFVTTGPHEYFLYRRSGAADPRPAPRLKRKSAERPPPHRPPTPIAPVAVAAPAVRVAHPQVAQGLTQVRRLADAGQLDEALRECRACLEGGEATAALYSLLGVIQQARHQETEAAAAFQKALYLDPNHQEALLHMLLLYQQRGDADQAAQLRRRLHRAAGEAT